MFSYAPQPERPQVLQNNHVHAGVLIHSHKNEGEKNREMNRETKRTHAHNLPSIQQIHFLKQFPQNIAIKSKLIKLKTSSLSVCPSVSPGPCEPAGRENHRYGDWTRNTGCLREFYCQDQRTQHKRSVTGPLSHSVSSQLHLLNLNQTTSCTEEIKLVPKVLSSLNPQ